MSESGLRIERNCDCCRKAGLLTPATRDEPINFLGKITWAYVCEACHLQHGIGKGFVLDEIPASETNNPVDEEDEFLNADQMDDYCDPVEAEMVAYYGYQSDTRCNCEDYPCCGC